MGLIQAALTSAGTVLADQWKEFFYCDSLDGNTLMVKGQKRVGKGSSNTKGSDNIISNGSTIAVNEGQAMMIVEQGQIVDFCAEPGEFVFDTSTEPSIFTGKLGESLLETFKVLGKRFTYGGDTGKDQRIYFFNTKAIIDNKYGTTNPVPFRFIDNNLKLDIEFSISVHGSYNYRMIDPMLFYKNIAGNVTDEYKRSQIDQQLKSEVLNALAPALAKISAKGIRYSELPAYNNEIGDALREVLKERWTKTYGLEIDSFFVNSATTSEENQKMITDLQRKAVYKDPSMGAAGLVDATQTAMVDAANNDAGAMTGFIGLNYAQNAAGGNIQNLYAAGAAQAPAADSWKCACGTVNTGNFCSACGAKKPAPAGTWTCACGTVNTGNFCSACGAKKPAPAGTWTCACGTVNTGNFCSACGAKKPE
ncbi:MAG: SPFH domain-containing protein [Lachnospiraceae bacterium]|nr:SPFH domain-containing protein [Lachnospiraceae bacterium]